MAGYLGTLDNATGYLEDRMAPAAGQLWDDVGAYLAELQQMDVATRTQAMGETGLQIGSGLLSTADAGIQGVNTLMTGGSLDESVDAIEQRQGNSFFNLDPNRAVSAEGQQMLQNLDNVTGVPMEMGVGALADNVFETTGSAAAGAATEALLGTFIGSKAKGRPRAGGNSVRGDVIDLPEAERRLDAGDAPQEVWQELGWMRDNRGDMQTEISDAGMEVDLDALNANRNSRLSDIIEHPELAEAYPQLMNNTSVGTADLGGKLRGAFYPNQRRIEINKNLSPEEQRKVLQHEVQHVVQEDSNLQGGTSPKRAKGESQDILGLKKWEHWDGNYRYGETRKESIANNIAQDMINLRELSDGTKRITPTSITNRGDWYKYAHKIRDKFGSMPKRSGSEQKSWLRNAAVFLSEKKISDYKDEYPDFDERVEPRLSMDKRELRNEARRLSTRSKKDLPDAKATREIENQYWKIDRMTDFEAYEKSAGEAQARLTPDRYGLSDTELRDQYPQDSFTDTWGIPLDKNDIIPSGKLSDEADSRGAMSSELPDNFDPRYDDRKKEQGRLKALKVGVDDRHPDVPEVSLVDYEGKPFVTSMADRTRAGGRLESINDVELESPVDLQGGQGYMFNNDGQVWASGVNPVGQITRRANDLKAMTGENPLFLPWRMAPTGGDFATMTGETMLSYAATNMRKGKIAKADKQIKQMIKGWKGIRNPESVEQYRAAPDRVRKNIKQVLDRDYRDDRGLSIGEARLAVSDPKQLSAPDGGLMNVGRILADKPIIERSGHPSYPRGISGEGLGRLKEDFGVYDLLESARGMRGLEIGQKPKAEDLRSLQMQPYSGIITDKLLKDLGL